MCVSFHAEDAEFSAEAAGFEFVGWLKALDCPYPRSLKGRVTTNIIHSSFPSRYKGAENQQMVDFSSSQSIFLIFLTSIVLAIISYFSAAPLMKLIGTGPDILDDAVIYFAG